MVFASSNHTIGMYNIADPSDRGTATLEDVTVVDPDDPPKPDGYYGISKITGEALGSFYADRHGIEVINMRIGWLLDRDELRAKQDSPERGRFARALWLSPRDCREVMRCSVDADLPANPVTVNAISRNYDRYIALAPTIRALDFQPKDDSAEVVEGTQ